MQSLCKMQETNQKIHVCYHIFTLFYDATQGHLKGKN